MKANVGQLFDVSRYDRKPPVDQIKFESENAELLVSFQRAVISSHALTRQMISSTFQRKEMDKNLYAVYMNSLIRKNMIRKFPLFCGHATKLRFKLVSASGEHIYIKKLNSDRRPSNIETEENSLIMHQRSRNSKELGCNIFLGYISSDDNLKIEGIYAVCWDGKEMVWEKDLMNFVNHEVELPGQVSPIREMGQSPKLKDDVVKIRRKKNG